MWPTCNHSRAVGGLPKSPFTLPESGCSRYALLQPGILSFYLLGRSANLITPDKPPVVNLRFSRGALRIITSGRIDWLNPFTIQCRLFSTSR